MIVLGVNVLDDPSDALALLADLGVGYPSVTDPDGGFRAALRWPRTLPTTYLVRANGTVQMLPPAVFRSPDEVAAAMRTASG